MILHPRREDGAMTRTNEKEHWTMRGLEGSWEPRPGIVSFCPAESLPRQVSTLLTIRPTDEAAGNSERQLFSDEISRAHSSTRGVLQIVLGIPIKTCNDDL